jgi:hypothetical protein
MIKGTPIRIGGKTEDNTRGEATRNEKRRRRADKSTNAR